VEEDERGTCAVDVIGDVEAVGPDRRHAESLRGSRSTPGNATAERPA
jgi:hypothetical protein